MGRKMKKWIKSNLVYIIIIIGLIIIVTVMTFFSRQLIDFIPLDKNDKNYDAYTSVYSGLTAGICTLVGGLFTLIAVLIDKNIEKKKTQDELIKRNIPEIYIPIKYAENDAIHIVLTSSTNKPDISPIRNHKIVLKNSSKCSFNILEVKINNLSYKMNIDKLHINEGDLFSFHFNYKIDINYMNLFLESAEKTNYCCRVSFENRKAKEISIEKINNKK